MAVSFLSQVMSTDWFFCFSVSRRVAVMFLLDNKSLILKTWLFRSRGLVSGHCWSWFFLAGHGMAELQMTLWKAVQLQWNHFVKIVLWACKSVVSAEWSLFLLLCLMLHFLFGGSRKRISLLARVTLAFPWLIYLRLPKVLHSQSVHLYERRNTESFFSFCIDCAFVFRICNRV